MPGTGNRRGQCGRYRERMGEAWALQFFLARISFVRLGFSIGLNGASPLVPWSPCVPASIRCLSLKLPDL